MNYWYAFVFTSLSFAAGFVLASLFITEPKRECECECDERDET